MDKFFDKLGDLLQSLLGVASARGGTYDLRDPDMREAIEELDAYLESGGIAFEESRDSGRGWRSQEERSRWKPEFVDPALRKDYATLEVAFAAPFADVRKEIQALANEVTQRLNEAFARIERQNKSRPG